MKKVICTWKNGVTKEIEVNCKSASVVAIAEIKIWCEKIILHIQSLK